MIKSTAVWAAEGAAAGGGDVKVPPGGGDGTDGAGGKVTAGDGTQSFLADKAADDKIADAPTQLPENWRDLMAGEDKEARKLLDRFKTLPDVAKTLREQQALISKGGQKTAPARPADDRPDELKAWREAQGLPPDPTGYKIADPVTKRFTDEDKPAIASFLDGMHKRDAAPTAVNTALEVYADMREQSREVQKQTDKTNFDGCQDELRQEWGSDFKANSKAARAFAEESIPGVNWYEARLPDGRRLGDVPQLVQGLVALAKLQYGDVAFVGPATAKLTEDRMSEIKKQMTDPASAYNTDGGKTKSEYFALVEADEARKRPHRAKGDAE